MTEFNNLIMTHKNIEEDNLSRIRDILFGEDLQGIEKQLSLFKEDSSKAFENLKDGFEDRFAKLEKLLLEKGEIAEDKQEKRIEVQSIVNNDFKDDVSKINLNILKEKTRVEKALEDTEDKLANRIDKLEDSLKSMIEKIMEDNNSRFNDLNVSKINKETLAEIFSGISEQLKK